MTKFKQYSEEQFASYLDKLGLFWDYERPWGSKNPDFTVYSDRAKKKIIAVVEIEDIDHTKTEKEILRKTKFLSRSGHPNTSERAKINAAREQLKFAKDYPCFLVINDHTAPPKPPILTLASMLGDLSISFPVWNGNKKHQGKPFNFFGNQGKMIDPKGNRIQNTTITAIGYIETINPDVILSGFGQMVKKIAKEVTDWNSKEQTNLYLKKTDDLEDKLATKGFDFNKTAVGVSFVINPYRRKRFPMTPFADKYTRVYKYSQSKSRILLVYDWSKN